MKNVPQKGASIAVVILVILGLVFLAQLMGFDLRLYWWVVAIIAVAAIILSK